MDMSQLARMLPSFDDPQLVSKLVGHAIVSNEIRVRELKESGAELSETDKTIEDMYAEGGTDTKLTMIRMKLAAEPKQLELRTNTIEDALDAIYTDLTYLDEPALNVLPVAVDTSKDPV